MRLLYDVVERHCDPGVGRFVQRDPDRRGAVRQHYTYGANRPFFYIDPSGRQNVFVDDSLTGDTSADSFSDLDDLAGRNGFDFSSNEDATVADIQNHLTWYGSDTMWVYHGHGLADETGQVVAIEGMAGEGATGLGTAAGGVGGAVVGGWAGFKGGAAAGGAIGSIGGPLGAGIGAGIGGLGGGITGAWLGHEAGALVSSTEPIHIDTLTPLIRAKANAGPAVIVLSGCKGNTMAARLRAAGVRAVFYYPMQIAETNSAEATRSLLTGLFQGHTLRNAMRGSQQFLEGTEGLSVIAL